MSATNKERLREKLGDNICDNEPLVNMTLSLIYEGSPVEDALVDCIKALYADKIRLADALLIHQLNQTGGSEEASIG